ncbi:hypothetical protein [Methylobacterium sp. 88A]|uniref:hypothetical protein n=1 Tax=Methylobacterium sp. 88A TaxID=1131813 RepID=UPI0012F6B867|nr:hypothetical protein [Methylobacterium sp. 88A]
MIKKIASVIALTSLMAGCQTTAQNQPVFGWMRADLRRITGNPELETQVALDKQVCIGETSKSAVGMAPIYYRGLGGAIGAAIVENQRGEALKEVAKGCMAERGYLYIEMSEADARLTAAEEARAKPKRTARRG